MAIYKNREVGIVSANSQPTPPQTVRIQYADGTQENVPLAGLSVTQAEKDALVKNTPSVYNNISVITDEDVKAVRLGVTPPSDPSFKEQAEVKARNEAQNKKSQEMVDAAKKNADKQIQDDLNKPASPVVETTSPSPSVPAQVQANQQAK